MRRAIVLTALLITACAAEPPEPDHQSEWREVLQQKKAAVSVEASVTNKQVYADSVAAFVRRHPQHSRARQVYQRLQLEFADDLSALGRFQDAIRFYRAVLTNDPANAAAQKGLASALESLAVSRDKLEKLEKGMSHRQVASLLGKPVPGWTARSRRRGTSVEAWYYRTTSGGIAGVYFRDGEVFAAETNSDAPLGL
ncbi:MAG TPA: hypothetical protein VF057_14410 [Thermoanaerobaculia bacterium]